MSSEFQVLISGTITAVSQNKDLTSPNSGTSVLQITGSWTGTLVVEGSNDEITYNAIQVMDTSTYLFSSSITANGFYLAPTNGYQFLRLRSSAWTSGTATYATYGSDAVSIVNSLSLIRGATNGTLIGNVSDSLKTNVTASALPTGAATESKQDTGNASLSSIDTKVATAAKQDTGNASLGSIDTKLSSQATAANQSTGNASLSSIDTKLTSQATAANQTTELTRLGTLTETAPASDTASSGLNGRLQRIAQRLTSLIALLPGSLGQKTMSASLAVTIASDQSTLPVSAASLPLPSGAATSANQTTGNASLSSIDSKVSTAALQTTGNASLSSIDGKVATQTTLAALEAKAATEAKQDSSISQQTSTNTKLDTLIAKDFATSAKQDTGNSSLSSIDGKLSSQATAANQTTLNTRVGDLTETAPASDTASSGLNGRLQRIAQRLTSLIALIPSAIGTAFFARIADGVEFAKVTVNQALSVSDGLKQGGVHGSLTLTTGGTAYEAKVGGSRLANRKLLTIVPDDDMYWGYDNTVTTSTGTPIAKNQPLIFDVDPDSTFQVWLVASASTKTARITESP